METEAELHETSDELNNIRKRPVAAMIILVSGIAVLLLGVALSISIGASDIKLSTVWDALFNFQSNNRQHQVIRSIRMPRALAGVLVGAAFAVAGAIMQGMTRNPLADPGLLGVNAGASFALVIVFAFVPSLPFHVIIMVCFIGAGIGTGLVYGTGYFAKGGLTPVRLALAGAVVSALLVGVSQAIAIVFQINYTLAFWEAGGVSAADWMQVKMIAPWIAGALVVAFLLSPYITILSLGEDIATGLGQRTGLIKGAGAIAVLILAGASVSTVGGVAFVGLVIPHIVRFLVGVDYRLIIPCSAVLGAALMVAADIGAKTINMPYETPIGSIIAVLGVPFFLYLARREKRELF